MATTDPIADMLTRIRNAQIAKHHRARVPLSKMKLRIAEILESEGYIESFEVSTEGHGWLDIELKYTGDREGLILHMQRASKPGRRVYVKHDEIPEVLGGMGVAIMSTSKGVMTGRAAEKQRVGGEVLCTIY